MGRPSFQGGQNFWEVKLRKGQNFRKVKISGMSKFQEGQNFGKANLSGKSKNGEVKFLVYQKKLGGQILDK